MKRIIVKKISAIVDNSSEYSERRLQLYHDIKEYLAAGYSKREIARKLHCGRDTVTKYEQGDFDPLCKKEYRSKIDQYHDMIVKLLSAGVSRMDVYLQLKTLGCPIKRTAAYDYMNKIAQRYQIDISIYKSTSSEAVQTRKKLNKYDHITRAGVFRFLWMEKELSEYHQKYITEKYPVVQELRCCILEFREIFKKKNMPMLYLFIEKYKKSPYKGLSRFARGLEKDIEAVENAVASDLSNGFVEGSNNKLKMIKRTMYGRCSKELLAAKMMYQPRTGNG